MSELYIVRRIGDGFIGLMPRPRGADLLEDDLAETVENGTKAFFFFF